jgi:hypothetical protein
MPLDHPADILPQMARAHEVAEILRLCIERMARRDLAATVTVLDFFLAELSPRFPDLAPWLASLRADADFWCDCAGKEQLAAMAAACLAAIPHRDFAIRTRKQLLVALWNSLEPDDRRAFRDRVMKGERS